MFKSFKQIQTNALSMTRIKLKKTRRKHQNSIYYNSGIDNLEKDPSLGRYA